MKYEAKARQRMTLTLDFIDPIPETFSKESEDKFKEEITNILIDLMDNSINFDEFFVYESDLFSEQFELTGIIKLRGSVEEFNYSDSPTEYVDNFEAIQFDRSDFVKKYDANKFLGDYQLHSIYLSISDVENIEYE